MSATFHSIGASGRNEFRLHDGLFAAAMFLLPFSLGEDIVVVSYSLPFFVVLCLYYTAKILREPVHLDRYVGDIFLISLAALVVMAITSLMADNVLKSLSRVAIHTNGLFLLYYFCSTMSGLQKGGAMERFYRLSRTFVISGVLMASYYIINFIYESQINSLDIVLAQRYVGGLASLTWGASNSVAAAILLPLILCLMVLSTPPPPMRTQLERELHRAARTTWIFFALIMIVGIAFTLSRNALAVMGAMIVYFLFQRSRLAIPVIGILAVLTVNLLTFDEDMSSLLVEQRFSGAEIDTLNTRFYIWADFLEHVRNNPFSPIGYYNSLFTFGHSGHNFALTTYIEQSIVGLAVAITLFVMLLRRALQLSRLGGASNVIHGRFLFVGLLLIGLNLQLEDANFTHQYIMYFWVFASLICYRFSVARYEAMRARTTASAAPAGSAGP